MVTRSYFPPEWIQELITSSTAEELMQYCEDKLAKYKWPTEIEFRTELPKTNVGKVLKKDLRAQEQEKA